MTRFKLNLLTAALMAGGLSVASTAMAQQAEDQTEASETPQENLEIIEVKGFSTSLIQSLNQKRFSDTVTEQLSADDLGGLPDVSMADALTRLPGISAVRTGGQAAEINIRGLSGDFVFSTLNGREQVSTSGSRSIEFDQYPSELISSAAVYKSPKASLIEGGVAGTVQLQTASPLSMQEEQKFSMNMRGMYNDRASEIPDGEEFGHRISFSYQTKLLDDTLGVALGFARLYQPSSAVQFIGFASATERELDNADSAPCVTGQSDPNCEWVSEGFEMQHKGGEETRNGYMAVVEWAPTDNFKLKADGFLSKFDSEAFARGFRIKFDGARANITNPVLLDDYMVGGNLSYANGSFIRAELVNDDNRDYDQVASYGINADWQMTDNLSVNIDISQSRAESDFRNGLLWSLVAEDANAATAVFDTNISMSYLLHGLDLPDVAFNQADKFTDINYVMASKYGIYPYQNEDKLNAWRMDFTYALDNDYIASISWGIRQSERTYSNDRSVFEYGSDSSFLRGQPPLKLTADMVEVVDFEGEFAYFPSYLKIDLDKALNAWFPGGIPQPVQTWGPGNPGVINGPGAGSDYSWTMTESGEVYEDVTSAYVMVNLDMMLGKLPVTGNVGVRRVDTEQASTTLQQVTMDIVDPDTLEVLDVRGDPTLGAQYITDNAGLVNDWYRPDVLVDKYTNYLPSLNLNFKLSDNQQLRFAAAKVMGRAPINRLFANANINVEEVKSSLNPDTGAIESEKSVATITGNSTNSPYLRPFLATQYDISYEHYFEETDGAFVAALFYKNIDSFVEEQALANYDFAGNGFNVPSEVKSYVYDEDGELVLDGDGAPLYVVLPTENGTYKVAVNNAKGGYIRGLELAYTQIYDFLPAPFNGLGISASYSFTETEITRTIGGGVYTDKLPGLSENVATLTVFWERDGFETRLSSRYRDAFVSTQVGVNEQTVNYDAELVMDFQASYDINENLGMVFQVNNLTDAPTKSYFGDKALTGTIQYFGRQFFLGATYTF
ncbi:TonB-dependent receptor [Bowmanella sp. JS7-9]|uniref:TonB-dependent receptor n=1 Tax=Pseudobowmanella zhangzhouensis TaxID=1537679 RepID=A0ABW1XL93_9ALTE|nr:TonB-dependent receptor [Bowmanella sp. JS7-9]TBX20395.1 TonB-dependent receptor [Bowmanella sp. JS7-9]